MQGTKAKMQSTRWDETWHRLREWTNGQAQSERLSAQILISQGFKDVDPSHPLGGPDGGKDAMCKYNEATWIMAVYFPRGQKKISEIEAKLKADLESAKKHAPAGIAFVTNQELHLSQRERLKKLASPSHLEIFHLDRIASILDAPSMAGVRYQYLAIESHDARPILEVGFYEPKSRVLLGTAIEINCTAYDEPLNYIPDLESRRQAFSPWISTPIPISTMEELNPAYMRDKDRYLRARALLREATIGIRNTSTCVAEGVILEIQGSLADGIAVSKALPRRPERKLINARMPDIMAHGRSFPATPSVETYGQSFRVTVEFGAVQPGHISLSRTPLFIGSKQATILTMQTRVVANNLPVPDESYLEVRFKIETRPPFDLDTLRS